jgi:hypothetical protein
MSVAFVRSFVLLFALSSAFVQRSRSTRREKIELRPAHGPGRPAGASRRVTTVREQRRH